MIPGAILFLSLLTFVPDAGSLKILMYSPRFGKSHVMFVGKLADRLAEAGHDVVLYQPIMNPEIANLTGSKHARFIERESYNALPHLSFMTASPDWAWDPKTTTFKGAIETLGMLGDVFSASCEQNLRDTKMMNRLKEEKFDIGLSEFFDVCGHGIFKRIGLKKTIVLYASGMPLDHATFFGLPASSSFVYDFVSRGSIEGFGGRFANLGSLLFGRYYLMKKFTGKTAEAYKVFDETLDYRELIGNSSYAFINMDEHLDFPRPTSHKYINIAGIGMKKAMENIGTLDKKYQRIFDTAKKGVIYFSMGTVATSFSMPKEIKQAFLEAFDEFPDINFLWKYEKPEHKISDGHTNVFTDTWLPQKEIMAHPKLLAFITHGGANSITEASYIGVPLILIPLFGDQERNALMIETKGTGIRLFKTELQKENIIAAIKKLIDEPKYNQRAKKLAQIMQNKPMQPDETFVKYVEFAAKYDVHEHIDMAVAKRLSTIAYYNVDVILVAFLIVFVLLTIVYLITRFVFRRICGLVSKKKTE